VHRPSVMPIELWCGPFPTAPRPECRGREEGALPPARPEV